MVATSLNYSEPRYQADDSRFSGVVKVDVAGFSGSGALLYDGKTILTAAHLFDNGRDNLRIHFDRADGEKTTLTASRVTVLPDYDISSANNDLALIRLSQSAPDYAKRHELYRLGDEVGQAFNFVGFGQPGTGTQGVVDEQQSHKLTASNRFDIDAALLDILTPGQIGWDPLQDSQLVSDFDNGSVMLDSIGRITGDLDTGIGLQEGMITPGDSGGPAFIGGQVAGVASYIASVRDNGQRLDINDSLDSSFGELGFWQRVSFYQERIDQVVRNEMNGAPSDAADVVTRLPEGDPGEHYYAYFLLEFSSVVDTSGPVSVAYTTVDGTATSGEDFHGLSGRVNIYPGDQNAVIAVEIIQDEIPEPNETFSLNVFDPIGGVFPDNQSMLSATRTIVDDDVLIV